MEPLCLGDGKIYLSKASELPQGRERTCDGTEETKKAEREKEFLAGPEEEQDSVAVFAAGDSFFPGE